MECECEERKTMGVDAEEEKTAVNHFHAQRQQQQQPVRVEKLTLFSAELGLGGAAKIGRFQQAYDASNIPIEDAIRSLDELNRRIDAFRDSPLWQSPSIRGESLLSLFSSHERHKNNNNLAVGENRSPSSPNTNSADTNNCRQRSLFTLESSVHMIQNLLSETQQQCVKMVNENNQAATHLDDELGRCHNQMETLRKELAHAHRCVNDLEVNMMINGSATESDSEMHNAEHEMEATVYRLREENGRMQMQIRALQQELNGQRSGSNNANANSNGLAPGDAQQRRNSPVSSDVSPTLSKSKNGDEPLSLNDTLTNLQLELIHTREALIALKHDRKRLKAEKVELLNQMKEVYQTLEAKELELRDFIRQFEQKMRESDKGIKELIWEKEKLQKEKLHFVDALNNANEKIEQQKVELDREKTENSKLHAQIKELQGRFVLLTGHQPAINDATEIYNDTSSSSKNGITPSSVGYSSMTTSPTMCPEKDDRRSTPRQDMENRPKVFIRHTDQVVLRRQSTPPQAVQNRETMVLYDDVGSPDYTIIQQQNAHRSRASRKDPFVQQKESGGSQDRASTATNRLSRLFHLSGRSKSKDGQQQQQNARKDQSNSNERRKSSLIDSCEDAIAADLNLAEKADQLVQARQIPMARWRQSHVLAWLELELSMYAYSSKFVDNVKSGKVLLTLTDYEIEHALGVNVPLHRKKLRLAIEEYRAPALCKFPVIKEVTNQYICRQWLPSLGLPQYVEAFRHHLIDGRLLNYLNKKQLDKYLGVSRRFHQLSILKGIELFRAFNFDIKALSKRRLECERENVDLLVWTNARLGKWCQQIDLGEYVDNLCESGVHGALAVLDPAFTTDTLASALGIPSGRQMVRKHLAGEFEALLIQARLQLERHNAAAAGMQKTPRRSGSGGSLGRGFSRSYTISGDQGFELTPPTDAKQQTPSRKRNGLRGSIGRVFGLRVRRSNTNTNEDNVEISPVRMSTTVESTSKAVGCSTSEQFSSANTNAAASTSSPKPLNRSTGTLSSTTSDLGSSIERSQHMKTIMGGTPKVLTQPPMTLVTKNQGPSTTVLKSSVSDAADLSRLQHLCLSPGENLLNNTSNSRNPLVRLRNKTRHGVASISNFSHGNSTASGGTHENGSSNLGRSPGSAPVRPHSVGDFGGLSYYHHSGNNGNHYASQQQHLEKRNVWWKPANNFISSNNNNNINCQCYPNQLLLKDSSSTSTDNFAAFSPQKLQTWLSVEHFTSVEQNNENSLRQNGALRQSEPQICNVSNSFGNGHTADSEKLQQQQQQQYVMGTIAEQGEPADSETEGQQDYAGPTRKRHSRQKEENYCSLQHRPEESPSRTSVTGSVDSASSPGRRDRPKSLFLRSPNMESALTPVRNKHLDFENGNCEFVKQRSVPPLASADSVHETDL